MVRATRGITDGAWYFEIVVKDLGRTGHTRLGWSTRNGDLQAPVGFDANSYAYRSSPCYIFMHILFLQLPSISMCGVSHFT